MKKIIFFLLFFFFAITNVYCETIILVPGWGKKEETIKEVFLLKKNIEEGCNNQCEVVIIKPIVHFPIESASNDLYGYLKEKGLTNNKVTMVGFSWGGIISFKFAELHPEKVRKIITIASPHNGYWFAQRFSGTIPKKISLFSIAGKKSVKKWWLREENDGVVDVDSALSQPSAESAVFNNLYHHELIKNKEVIDKVVQWINNERTKGGDEYESQ